jgi:hypothetical protein
MNPDGFLTNNDGTLTAESTGNDDFDDYDGLFETQDLAHSDVDSPPGLSGKNDEFLMDTGKSPSCPSKSSSIGVSAVSPCVRVPSVPSAMFQPGDRVITPNGEGEIAYQDGNGYRVNSDMWSKWFPVEHIRREIA